jgi:multicomponent Na+:H+ antiporter subunit C
MIMHLYVMNSGVILLFVSIGYISGGQAAIFENVKKLMVDPLPQAVMLTTIVIGLGITALALALAIKIYDEYKTLDTKKLLEK